MTNKEFEAKKQEIIQEIKELILIPLHPCADVESELIEHEGLISERIKQLQSPNPPTCATCKHFIQELDNAGSCQKLVANEIINFTDGIATLVFTDFGCNWHSSYEVVE